MKVSQVDHVRTTCWRLILVEVSDKLTQNELDELEGTLKNTANGDTSFIEGLLDKLPEGIFGGDDKKDKMHNIQENANNSQMENMSVSPREPEEFTRYVQQVFKNVMPAIEFHDEVMQAISEAIENIPILPKIIEQLEEQMSVWVFSIIAPMVVPILQQVKNELRTGSAEIISSSEAEQHVVFDDDRSTDPTHSMLSKDHFSNVGLQFLTLRAWRDADDGLIDPQRGCWRHR